MRKETKNMKEMLEHHRRKYAGRIWRGDETATCNVIRYLVRLTMCTYEPNQTEAYKRYFKEFYIWLIKDCNNIGVGYNSFIRYEMYRYRCEPGDLLYLLDHDDRIKSILFI